jgi:hypothetical protein
VGPGFTRPITQNAEQVPRSQRWWKPASCPTEPRFATNTVLNIGSGSIIASGSSPNRSSQSAPRTSAPVSAFGSRSRRFVSLSLVDWTPRRAG